MNDTYKPDVTNKTYNPVENGIWKGKVEERLDNVEKKTNDFVNNFNKINDKLDNIWIKLNSVDREVTVLKTQFSMLKWFVSIIPIVITIIYFLNWILK